ncbi:3-oxoacyl-ACP reductase FabG [Amycolatopsis rubida]|uniref:3-oxoacyl-ACP reductase FabG n=1 Tax=Amycolatopsis rubida TaxID=112413 RepID=A0A1I5F6P8_9PSEU|nr:MULTISPECIES: 3-oxoacyl-ACP reductase family protein [Amycolatopsis]MYW92223.1 SDR family oxidoreductase [Amycolatopsis rubida]NEC57210.1 3-oxoacyl-ACP reductase FabG [Amycolatopsis rubida]OAP27077.1 Cyclic-di-GMP-binding biofilm dispersal mediator protein [Amycolatopsis sp. M39]SFO19402.1 NAD(P)-dependent dehydrogenase, short-chain alcohol dehydrogenase family [Amycolatopsis rubida]
MDLDGKVALVTGGSRGIGAATALRLAEAGADVVLTYAVNAEQAAGVVDRIKALGRRALAVGADSADSAAVEAAVEAAVAEFGRLDVLVNNAGVGFVGPLEQTGMDDVDRVLAVNVRGVLAATKAAAKHLREGGRVITIGSCVTDRVPGPGMVLYAVSKSAMVGLTKALARELAANGVTVNLVHPGPTDTEMNPADGPYAADQASMTAAGRYGNPAEVAAAVAFLASPDSAYITAATLSVDGGHAA